MKIHGIYLIQLNRYQFVDHDYACIVYMANINSHFYLPHLHSVVGNSLTYYLATPSLLRGRSKENARKHVELMNLV
jgi:hypothetical protein